MRRKGATRASSDTGKVFEMSVFLAIEFAIAARFSKLKKK